MLPDFESLRPGSKAYMPEILGGDYAIERGEDLPFMPVVQKVRKRPPITVPIDAMTAAHKKGLTRD